MNVDIKKIKELANIELARKDFFHYCHLTMPTFYKYNRKYLVEMAKEMQEFYESNEDILVINVPP